MFRELRRKNQQLSETEARSILKNGTHGVLSVQGDDGYPYGVPMNYVYGDDAIYFHCAKEGHKLEGVRRSDKVSFCVVGEDEVIPEAFSTAYTSVIVFGRAEIVADEKEKREALKLLAERFSDRVTHFFTLNEPQCFVGLGFVNGEHAPGIKAPIRDTFEMAHNVMKAHGRAVQMLRTHGKQPLVIGYAPTASVCYPATEKAEDIEAAKKSFFALPDEFSNWHWNVTWWSDPVLLGKYPEEGLAKYEPYLPKITEEDMRLISQPIDVYGQNIYNGYCVRMGEDGRTETVSRYEGFPKTAIDWPVTPECLYWGPKFLYERYQKPIYITENGLSCHDVISLDGKVHDPNRIDFLARYLHELKKAAGEIDLRGYFQWSLMDNFEWAKGYSERFGLVYVDYPTQKRILKDSAYWYQKIIKENGSTL